MKDKKKGKVDIYEIMGFCFSSSILFYFHIWDLYNYGF